MARGATFLSLRTQLRDELRRASDVAVGVDDVPSLNQAINTAYEALYLAHDWPILRKIFSKSMAAGSRYYDPPDGLNVERVEEVKFYWNGLPSNCERGIGFEQYAAYDSDAAVQSDPVLRWDVRWTGSVQIEVWPIPATNSINSLKFKGIQSISTLVSDSDVCYLDDKMVVGFAAARLTKGDDRKDELSSAQDFLRALRARSHGAMGTYRLGLGQPHEDRTPPRATVRVTG